MLGALLVVGASGEADAEGPMGAGDAASADDAEGIGEGDGDST